MKVALDDNHFNCTLPNIEAFVDLQVFSVARNHFTGSPPEASDLQKLVKLYVMLHFIPSSGSEVSQC